MGYIHKKFKRVVEDLKKRYDKPKNKIKAVIGYGSIAYKKNPRDLDLIIIREKGGLQLIKDTKRGEDIVIASNESIKETKEKEAPIAVKPPLSSATTPNILLYEKNKGEYKKLKEETTRELVKSVIERIRIAFPEADKEIMINPKQLVLINRVLIEPKVKEDVGYLNKWFESKKRGEDPFEKIENFLDENIIKGILKEQGLFIKEERIPKTNEVLFKIRLPKQVSEEKTREQIKKGKKRLKRLVEKKD